jgi:hypothetical protein
LQLASEDSKKITTIHPFVSSAVSAKDDRLWALFDRTAYEAVRKFHMQASTAHRYAPSSMYYRDSMRDNTWVIPIEKIWEQLGTQFEKSFGVLCFTAAASSTETARISADVGQVETIVSNFEGLRQVAEMVFSDARDLTVEERRGLRRFYKKVYKQI